jgi:hypothetical protein
VSLVNRFSPPPANATVKMSALPALPRVKAMIWLSGDQAWK